MAANGEYVMNIKHFFVFVLLSVCIPASAQAKIIIASGAGYRSLVDDLVSDYTTETCEKVECIYGNMARITAQARNSGVVDLMLGDKSFLDRANLDFSTVKKVGKGRLVIVFPKGKNFSELAQLLSNDVSRIALPDIKRAIYGKAALEYLHNKKIFHQIEQKLLMVSTIPQAASYIVAEEVDYAFINLTHARKISKSIGGYVAVDESAYSPILIIIGQLPHSTNAEACGSFINFLDSENASRIISTHGMQVD
jgi:molybdate transport system substrate-binding protein